MSCLSAWAGPNDSGGGKGVVCRTKNGAVESVELLDLWEARELYERKIVYSNEAIEQQIDEGIERLKNVIVYPYYRGFANGKTVSGAEALAYSLRETAIPINSKNWGTVKRLRGIRLTQTPDSYEDAIPDQCQIEQLIQYKDVGMGGGSSQAFMNQDLVDRMDLTNQAALALHEALYAELRKFGEKTSIRTRRAVGYVMSGQSFKSLDSFLKETHITCESKGRPTEFGDATPTRIHYVKQPNGLVNILPEKVAGILMMGFEQMNSGSPDSIEEKYKQVIGGGIGQGTGLSTSPVDFDLSAMTFAKGKGNATIQLVRTASGAATPVTDNLRCKLVKK